MEDKGIKVVVDYSNGYYNITGTHNGNKFYIKRNINYSRDNVKRRRILEILSKEEPNFLYSEKMIEKVDPLMYEALREVDENYGTKYAINYLKSFVQKFEKSSKESRNGYIKKCIQNRKESLEQSGIDISYNVGLLNSNNKIRLLDRIKGMIIAKNHGKLCNIKVESNIIFKGDYYLENSNLAEQETNSIKVKELSEKFKEYENAINKVELQVDNISSKIKTSNNIIESNNKSAKVSELANENDEQNVPKVKLDNKSKNIQQMQKFKKQEKRNEKENFIFHKLIVGLDAEKRYWTRKIKSTHESIKNLKSKYSENGIKYLKKQKENNFENINEIAQKREQANRNKQQARTIKVEADNKEKIQNKDEKMKIQKVKIVADIEKRIQKASLQNKDKLIISLDAEKRYWIRKINNVNESIKNMKFKPKLNKNGKKILISGAVTLLSAGLIFSGVQAINNFSNLKDSNVNQVESFAEEVLNMEKNENSLLNEIEKDNIEDVNVVKENDIVVENVKESENIEQDNSIEDKTDEEKIEETIQQITQKYNKRMVIKEELKIGDIFSNQTYSQNTDGTGKQGHFSEQGNYMISHINIVTQNGVKVVKLEGKNLDELLNEYPDCITYNIHFIDSESGGGLGFVTKEQYEQIVQNKIDEVINSITQENTVLNNNINNELER